MTQLESKVKSMEGSLFSKIKPGDMVYIIEAGGKIVPEMVGEVSKRGFNLIEPGGFYFFDELNQAWFFAEEQAQAVLTQNKKEKLNNVRKIQVTPENMQSICTQAVNSFGDAPQMLVAIEEMAELTQALSKSGRYGIEAARAQVLEEMADVYIMLEQLKIIFNFSAEEVQREQAVKLEKLKKYLGSKKK